MNHKDIDKEVLEKGLIAPRITTDYLESLIVKEDYHVFSDTTTVCALTLKNGYVVIGHSACASKENFDQELGRKISRSRAFDNIWPLEGYILKEKLFLK